MNPINITNSDYCNNCNIAGFAPNVHYAFSKSGNTVTFYDTSTLPSGVSFVKAKFRVTDKFGGQVRGAVTLSGSTHTAVVDVSSLNLTKGFDMTSTVVADGIVADGNLNDVSSAADGSGFLTNWDGQIAPAQI